MQTHNPSNERIKRQYFAYLKEAKRHSEATVDAVAKALARFEADTKYRDFKAFHMSRRSLSRTAWRNRTVKLTGEKLSKATLHATLADLKRFFQWLAGQPGYKSRLQIFGRGLFQLVRERHANRDCTARKEIPDLGAGQACHCSNAEQLRDRAARSCAYSFYATDRGAGQCHRIDETEARRSSGWMRLPRRPRSEHQVQ